MDIEKVKMLVSLKGRQQSWVKGEVLSRPIPSEILKEIRGETGTVEVLSRIVDAPPETVETPPPLPPPIDAVDDFEEETEPEPEKEPEKVHPYKEEIDTALKGFGDKPEAEKEPEPDPGPKIKEEPASKTSPKIKRRSGRVR